ncbi:hypothetical protein BpHYR1_047089 [Brachionus plicatilis]|uniref:Uncharacterized protein n=1 Tax=Brachionus plicatilis TaxID=10195 RepID=A0A3M7SGY7_BRAPC|nr:hypothetical protein BpHYR1_047089 [Brachionus plicatilis]
MKAEVKYHKKHLICVHGIDYLFFVNSMFLFSIFCLSILCLTAKISHCRQIADFQSPDLRLTCDFSTTLVRSVLND